MIILGLNAYHGDSSACIVVDGRLVAAVEEERFARIKHWAGLPIEAVKYCLDEAGISIEKVNHIAINRDPKANFMKKTLYAFSTRASFDLVRNRFKNATKVLDIKNALGDGLGVTGDGIKARMHNVEHHVAHLSSSFFVCPFEEAACVSIDGFGDFVGAMWGQGNNNELKVKGRTFFPHSLGLFYLAFTQYLGFPNYGDEYKVMGLAAYGEPEFMNEMRNIVKTSGKLTGRQDEKLFYLDLDYFIHHSEGVAMTWEGGEPKMGPVFSKKLVEFLGPARSQEEPIEQRHKNIAASLQKRYEEVCFHILNYVHEKTGSRNLALAGGCAMNSLANGKLFHNTPFREVYIQPAAGDAGGAIGAAFYIWNQVLGKGRSFVLEKSYLGPEFSDETIRDTLSANSEELKSQGCTIEEIDEPETLCRNTARDISEGKVIGWFQGRMEWGPRALGNRSIICDPRRANMKEILNLKIKRRESFRPFAPSIHLNATDEYFEINYPDPFMLKVYKIRPEKRSVIPAVTHVDGTGRLQTVRREDNPRYWQLIEEFRKITGIPVVLNTSFNENEPIVCRPEEALDCFLRTKMDILVINNYVISRDKYC
jgi:carbamoyltransferase